MKPISTTLRGFGPHSNTTIEWDNGTLALVGDNGNGKTFLLEGIPAAFYGEFPSRPGSLYDCVTQGYTGKAEILAIVESRGLVYKAHRVLDMGKKTPTQEATLYENEKVIAGPKVRDFESRVAALFGDAKTALATWFSPQGGKGDLCGALPSERRQVFANLLNFDELDNKSERFKKEAIELEAEIKVLDSQLSGLPDHAAIIEAKRAELEGVRKGLEANRRELESVSSEIERLLDEHQKVTEEARELQFVASAADAAEQTKAKSEQSLSVARSRLQTLRDRAGKLTQCLAAAGRLTELNQELERLEALQAEHLRFKDHQTLFESANREVARCETALRKARKFADTIKPSDEAVWMSSRLEDFKKEAVAAKSGAFSIQKTNSENDNRRATLQAKIELTASEVEALEGKASKRPETPFGDQCAPCQLLKEWASIPAQLQTKRDDREELEQLLGEVPQNVPVPDVAEAMEKEKSAELAQQKIDEHKRALKVAEDAETDLEKASAELTQVRSNDVPQVSDQTSDIAVLRDSIRIEQNAAAGLEAAKQATYDLNDQVLTVSGLAEELEAATVDCIEKQQRAATAREQLASLDQRKAELKADGEEKRSAEINLKERIEAGVASESRLETEIENLRAREQDTASKRRLLKSKRQLAEQHRTLQTIFGRRGVQPILIDAAAPQLESIAEKILETLTDGRLSLRFSTQAARKAGYTSEDFLILARDHRGERDVSTFSGGEKRILQTTLRLSIMIWVASLRGRQSDCLFVDEGFDALDGDNADRMVEVLRDLGRRFGLVVAVTHDEHLATKIGRHIRLTKSMSGVTAEASWN